MKTIAAPRAVPSQPSRFSGRVLLFQSALWLLDHGSSRTACAVLSLLQKHFRPFRDPMLQNIVRLGYYSHQITIGTDPDNVAETLLEKQIP